MSQQSHFYTSDRDQFGFTDRFQWYPYLITGLFREEFVELRSALTGTWVEVSTTSGDIWTEISKPSSISWTETNEV